MPALQGWPRLAIQAMALLFLVLSASPALATKPASSQVWIDLPAIQKAAKVFPEADAGKFNQEMEKILAKESTRGSQKELPKNFSRVGMGGSFYSALDELVSPSLASGNVKLVERFFEALNKGLYIRGFHSSGGKWIRDGKVFAGGGSSRLRVEARLAVGPGGQYEIHYIHKRVDTTHGPMTLVHVTKVPAKASGAK